MAKANKSWTPERRAAASAAAKARLAAKPEDRISASTVREHSEQDKLNEQLRATPPPSTDSDLTELTRQVKEALEEIQRLKANQAQTAPQQQSQMGIQNGALTGTYERYQTSKNYYPSPVERLSREPRLERFAFADNYELKWEVQLSQYETADHVRTKEPRFNLKLIVKVYDDLTGELTNRRFVILQGIFHEDPDAAIYVANENGIAVDSNNEKDFLDEMRYLRFRDWLLEAFYPTPPPAAANKKEVVIGNKLVEVYEVTSDKSESMAGFFGNAPSKL